MLNIVGTLLKNFSRFSGSGAWSISDKVLIVSFTLPAVSPHPLSKPHCSSLLMKNEIQLVNYKYWSTSRSIKGFTLAQNLGREYSWEVMRGMH